MSEERKRADAVYHSGVTWGEKPFIPSPHGDVVHEGHDTHGIDMAAFNRQPQKNLEELRRRLRKPKVLH